MSKIDKTRWGDGPWMNEPDELEWTDNATGLSCRIRRGPLGNLWGYVGVDRGHPAYGTDRDDPDLSVHGGVTFSGEIRPGEKWWIGFDCAHLGDFVPGGLFHMELHERYREIEYVKAQCASLASQLAAEKSCEQAEMEAALSRPDRFEQE
jgi:hypothetical protein